MREINKGGNKIFEELMEILSESQSRIAPTTINESLAFVLRVTD